MKRFSTLLLIAATSSTFAHDASLPHVHPHAAGSDSSTLIIASLAGLAFISALLLFRRGNRSSQR